jgi:hypothetical protein
LWVADTLPAGGVNGAAVETRAAGHLTCHPTVELNAKSPAFLFD